ncbi:MAG TPA: CBS domain-containing protein [Anaerolineae bacterium]
MAFLSELINRDVRTNKGALVGKLRDVLILPANGGGEKYPRVVALAVAQRQTREPALIPWEGTEDLAGNRIILQKPAQTAYQTRGGEIWLARDVLDKQVIDTNDHRMVRVNDLEFGKIGTDYRLINVDIGGRGLLRRLGLEDTAERIAEVLHQDMPGRALAWNAMDFLPSGGLRVQVPREKIKELHPADIAEILEDVGPRVGAELIRHLADEQVADTLEELEPDFQAEVIETFTPERQADIVEEMEPDEAADLLNALEPEQRQNILQLMEPEEKEQVQELLGHEKDTAGGLMTTKYISIPPGLTCAQAIEKLRADAEAKEAETIYYVYVADEQEKLLGVCSLSDLVLADPNTPVEAVLHRHPIVVTLETPRDEVLEQISKYNLLAVPVVNDDNVIQGIVTADDAIDMILPNDLKIKLPRVFGS